MAKKKEREACPVLLYNEWLKSLRVKDLRKLNTFFLFFVFFDEHHPASLFLGSTIIQLHVAITNTSRNSFHVLFRFLPSLTCCIDSKNSLKLTG